MATVSPQLSITQTIIIPQSEILTLNSIPAIMCPAEAGYINVFEKAILFYSYRNAVFTNVNNVLEFYLTPPLQTPILISNSLNGTNILGLDQNTNTSFIPANPYTPRMSSSYNAPIILKIDGSDPTGGSPQSTLSVAITYSIFQL